MKALSNITDIRRKLRFMGDELDNVDVQEELEEANRKLVMNAGRYYKETITILDGITEYELTFKPIITFIRIITPDGTLPEEDYTVDHINGIVTFLEEPDFEWVNTFYIPEIYKDLEILYTCESILGNSFLATTGEAIGSKTQEIRGKIKLLESSLMKRKGILPFTFRRTGVYDSPYRR